MEELNDQAHGSTMQHVTKDRFGGFKLNLPPLDLQETIVSYLNRETAHIDALIAEKERMLALLDEKRAALISQAVTRGLDPDVPLKPSGLDWLGDIPVMALRGYIQAACPAVRERAPRIRFSHLSNMLLPLPTADEHGK